MIIPIRCYTCGGVLANKWTQFVEAQHEFKTSASVVKTKKDEKLTRTRLAEILDECNLHSECCRMRFMTSMDAMDVI